MVQLHDVAPEQAISLAALSFEDVGLRYPDGTEALSHIDLSVRRGEFVAVVGPSGCGKSTLLRVASGLLDPTSGMVHADREHLGYVFQDATLLPWRTVADNVGLLAELHGIDKSKRKEIIAAAISLVALEGFEDYHPRRLSGGMRMRVSLARSLTLHPDVFLFDEPFGALDELTREHLNDELLALFVSQRFAGVFVTHSVLEAVFLSTRVVVMSSRPGRIVAEVPVDFGYPRPPELRFDPALVQIAGRISAALREADG
jgi:NitT/TauT family transport system ATP-binding protein